MVGMTTSTEPWFVGEARTRKAATIAETLRTLGFSADDVAHFTVEDRNDAERAAQVRLGSSAHTWRIVTNMLAGSADPEALCATCGLGDPEGVEGPRKPWHHNGPCSK